MGVQICADTIVKLNTEYLGEDVSLTCKYPTGKQQDAYAKDLIKVQGNKVKTDTSAARKHVLLLIKSIDGVDMPVGGASENWRAITSIGDEEKKHLLEFHSALLTFAGNKLFNPVSEADEDEDSVPLD